MESVIYHRPVRERYAGPHDTVRRFNAVQRADELLDADDMDGRARKVRPGQMDVMSAFRPIMSGVPLRENSPFGLALGIPSTEISRIAPPSDQQR